MRQSTHVNPSQKRGIMSATATTVKQLADLLGVSEKEIAKMTDEQIERRKELVKLEAELKTENEKITGVATRWMAGQTRGKASLVIKWRAFPEDPAMRPKTPAEFMEVTGVKDEPSLVQFLVDGYNDAQYTAASDPLAEYVEPHWPDEAQTNFRLVVRNYAKVPGQTLETAVALIKPGFESQWPKAK